MKIAIAGGGISGLTAAWRLRKLMPDAEISLFEASDRLGGFMHTVQEGPFLFETGPRTFSARRSPELLQLIEEAGLGSEILFSSPRSGKRFLWHKGRLRSAGSLALRFAPSLILELFRPGRPVAGESVHAFACRRFGKAAAELLFDPLTLGIFAASSRDLAVEEAFPDWAAWEARYGSVLRGLIRTKRPAKTYPGSLFTLKHGMRSLVEALANTPCLRVHLRTPVLSLSQLTADRIVLALPYRAVQQLLSKAPPIACSSLSVVNIGLNSPPNCRGYGYLVPSGEGEDLLGMIWDGEVFPSQGSYRMTAMVRPHADPKAVVLDALKRHLGVTAEPAALRHACHEEAIPLFQQGHRRRIAELEAAYPSICFLGNYLNGVSVEHCVSRANSSVKNLIQS